MCLSGKLASKRNLIALQYDVPPRTLQKHQWPFVCPLEAHKAVPRRSWRCSTVRAIEPGPLRSSLFLGTPYSLRELEIRKTGIGVSAYRQTPRLQAKLPALLHEHASSKNYVVYTRKRHSPYNPEFKVRKVLNRSARIAGGCCVGGDAVQRASLVCAIALRHFLMNPIQEEANAEALRRIREANATQATTLDLSGLHSLTQIPRELEQLTSLQALNLSWFWQLTQLALPAGLNALQTLYLSRCLSLRQLALPAGLNALRTLSLFGCEQLSGDLSPLAGLTSLQILFGILRRDLSVSYNKVGDVMLAQGKLQDALAVYQQGLAIAKRLAEQDKSNSDWQRECHSIRYVVVDYEGEWLTCRSCLIPYQVWVQPNHFHSQD